MPRRAPRPARVRPRRLSTPDASSSDRRASEALARTLEQPENATLRGAVEPEQAVAVHVGEAPEHLVGGRPFNCGLLPERGEALPVGSQLAGEALEQWGEGLVRSAP